ncbi:carbohydrate ABC transporter membrane protein 2 (CUT1 family) [Saccharothrix carnea]|uniref:Carbohydrate ABC transporter membrane protein 2 (CUT1 family) n=1 Tax=Saccharothrix carnea TaxID=1280637 RepID=A0A2P8IBN2_SACCR|nr:carbohydrate ABC transporter permease [Saccharothrix carnea]PSL55871.1 carbohydrate ABC transporter membrane protein 2 (CUT1 family) [Saccharothrix carnea]
MAAPHTLTDLVTPGPVEPRPTDSPERRRGLSLGKVLGYAVLVVAAVGLLLPFFWMVSSSLKTNSGVFSIPVTWFPDSPQWGNYAEIWRISDMLVWLKNTVFLSVVVTVLQLFTGSFAAYGFAKTRFPGRNLLFLLYIGTIAVPWQAYMIPQFIMMSEAGLTNTPWAIIALQAFGAFGVFLMRQYYATIPDELCEAARVDGLSEYGIYFRIMLPLSVPALASLALLTFVTTWNDYLGPLIYLRDPDLWTIQLGLKSFVSEYNAEHALIMTGSVLSVLPIAVVFLLGQKYFVQGIATSGMKG